MKTTRLLFATMIAGGAACAVEPSTELGPVTDVATDASAPADSGASPPTARDASATPIVESGEAGARDADEAGDASSSPHGGPPLVVPPIANAARGQWQAGDIGGMSYHALFPHGYSKAYAYPLILFLHQLDNASQIPQQIDPWFNDVQFRSEFPAIVIAPQCDQSADPSGQTINWGGVTSAPQPCQDGALALVERFVKNESVFADKIYVTGDSMGGIGSWDLMIKYNTEAPTIRPLFAASMILAGATYAWGYPTPNQAVVSALKDVPIWAIHGADDTQVPTAWDENMFAAQQAQGGAMKLTLVPNQGHDVWDDTYPMPGSRNVWSWLFAQSR